MLVIPETAPLITGKRAVVYVEAVRESPGPTKGGKSFWDPGPRGTTWYGKGCRRAKT